LEEALTGGRNTLSGEVAFKLHDTYGFPMDLSADVCREKGVKLDEAGFHEAMDKQKSQARAAGKFKMDKALEYHGEPNQFVGYDKLNTQTKVLGLYVNSQSVDALVTGQEASVVLAVTPFYAESGGQVGDQGVLTSNGMIFEVHDTQKIKADVFVHVGVMKQGNLKIHDSIQAQVNEHLRASTKRHHSATHLMHFALRKILGNHVQQKGSLVTPDKTRFDFAHDGSVSAAQLKAIEQCVNEQILHNQATRSEVMSLEDASHSGATMLFGEKYAEQVRVLSIGESKELCGGTHVSATGDIGLFKIVSESGVASGVRRIEAVVGESALDYVNAIQLQLHEVCEILRSPSEDLVSKIKLSMEHQKNLEKEITQLKSQNVGSQIDELAAKSESHAGVNILIRELKDADTQTLKEMMDRLKDKLGSAVIVLACVQDGKVQLSAGVTRDLVTKVKAGELVNFAAQQVGGKGGGKPDSARGGGRDASGLQPALAKAKELITAAKI
jgi:alanyl-tRNA synthetase